MRIEDLSVNERILIHLKDFSMDPESEGALLGQTQEGIAEAVGIRINHVPRSTNSLLKNGYIGEALIHIGGLKRRRKAFFLTSKGAGVSQKLISKARDQKVAFRDSAGKEEGRAIKDIIFGARATTPSRLILSYFRDGVIVESSLGGNGNAIHISMLNELPEPDVFVDRTREIDFIRSGLESGQKLVIISGMKGIGKTSLARIALKGFEGRKNIFCHSVHEWDTARSVLEKLSEFFVRLGRNELKKTLRIYRDADIGQGASALLRDAGGSESILVIDNIFDLKKEVMHLLSMLCEQSRNLEDASIVLITRDRESLGTTPGLRDIGANDLILKGLGRDSAMKLMLEMGLEPEDSDRVFAMTQGHPLAIKLVNSEEISRVIDTKGLTKEEVWVVRCMKAFDAIFED